MEQENDNILQINSLVKSYGKKEVLKGLNLEVKKGEIFGLIGKNGVGKSTTIDCIIGSKVFTSGEILIDGKSIVDEPLEVKKLYGYTSSEPTVYETMTGYDYLVFVASIYNVPAEIFNTNLELLLKKFDLTEDELMSRTKTYSHGMKQKLCLIASLIHNPKIWILDEPTVGLDAMAYESLISVIQDFVKNGRTVLITSHNLDMVGKLCNRVAIINEGVVARLVDLDRDSYFRTKLNKVFFAVYGGE